MKLCLAAGLAGREMLNAGTIHEIFMANVTKVPICAHLHTFAEKSANGHVLHNLGLSWGKAAGICSLRRGLVRHRPEDWQALKSSIPDGDCSQQGGPALHPQQLKRNCASNAKAVMLSLSD
eukprot:scaffold261266_cov44-Prasinocladus_malaysianus.AAC.1